MIVDIVDKYCTNDNNPIKNLRLIELGPYRASLQHSELCCTILSNAKPYYAICSTLLSYTAPYCTTKQPKTMLYLSELGCTLLS